MCKIRNIYFLKNYYLLKIQYLNSTKKDENMDPFNRFLDLLQFV